MDDRSNANGYRSTLKSFFETLSDFRAAEGSYPNADTHVTPASLNGYGFGVSESVLFSQGPRHFRFAID